MNTYRKSDFAMIPVEDCSREPDEYGVSEYFVRLALSRIDKEEFTHEELKNEVAQVMLNDTMSTLVDKGLIKAIWDEKQQAIVYEAA